MKQAELAPVLKLKFRKNEVIMNWERTDSLDSGSMLKCIDTAVYVLLRVREELINNTERTRKLLKNYRYKLKDSGVNPSYVS
jgi:hypothetical protein